MEQAKAGPPVGDAAGVVRPAETMNLTPCHSEERFSATKNPYYQHEPQPALMPPIRRSQEMREHPTCFEGGTPSPGPSRPPFAPSLGTPTERKDLLRWVKLSPKPASLAV